MSNDEQPGVSKPLVSVPVDELVTALRSVIAQGLPASEEAGGLLLNLRSVYARSVLPGEVRSRLAALNELLPRLIGTLADPRYREAVQILFGLAPGTRGTTLTNRRRQAAAVLNFSESHFREEKEIELLRAVAIAIHDDLLRYQPRVLRASESLEVTGDTPRLAPESFTHEEELISRIWAAVYGLRAELIAGVRLGEVEGYEAQAEDHRQAGDRQAELLRAMLAEFTETYGSDLVRHGETEITAAALERLRSWRP